MIFSEGKNHPEQASGSERIEGLVLLSAWMCRRHILRRCRTRPARTA